MFKFVTNTNTRVTQLKSGEVHVVALVPWDKFREMSAVPGIVVRKTPGNAYEHVTLNEKQFPPFADVRVRARADLRARSRAVQPDRSSTGSRPWRTARFSRSRGRTRTDRAATASIRRRRARCSTRRAGRSAPTASAQRDGQPLAFTLITQAGYAIRENIAQAIEQQLRDVGVDVKVELQDGTAISAVWFEGRFDAMLHWWQMPSDPELTMFFAADRTPPAGRNINYFRDDELTRLLYASDRTVDRAEAQARCSSARRRSSPTRCRKFRSTTSRASTPCPRRCSTSKAIRRTPASSGTCTNGKSNKLARVVRFLARRCSQALPLLLVDLRARVRADSRRARRTARDVPARTRTSGREDIERLRRALGLDRPLWHQYRSVAGRIRRAATGATASATAGRSTARVLERLPATLELVGVALAARRRADDAARHRRRRSRRGRWFDRVTTVGVDRRHFAAGVLVRAAAADVFAVGLGWLPSSGRATRRRRRRRRSPRSTGDAGGRARARAGRRLVALPARVDDRGARAAVRRRGARRAACRRGS